MKTAGIIAEYNPFHKGHLYHINKTKEITGADFIIIVLSSDFVQRGAPALADKFLRTDLALKNGADLVIELPVCYSCSSAESFAHGSVSLLNSLNVVDFLSFGSESGKLEHIQKIARVLTDEPKGYKTELNIHLKNGCSFPAARAMALNNLLSSVNTESINKYDICSNISDLTALPNNILGIEYLKALNRLGSSIKPITIERNGDSYNNSYADCDFASALSIRNMLKSVDNSGVIKDYVPESVNSVIESNFNKSLPLYENDFSLILKYKLISESKNGFTDYLDVSKELSDRITNNLSDFTDFDGFCAKLKHKQYTYTRIRRCLIHILLNIKKDSINIANSSNYCRILGFKKSSSKLIAEINKKSSIPVITKPGNAARLLDNEAYKIFNQNADASHIYHSVIYNKFGGILYNEYRQNPIISD